MHTCIRHASANTKVKCISEKGGGVSNIPFPTITGSVDVISLKFFRQVIYGPNIHNTAICSTDEILY